MKVVVNRCWGGFGLSPAAILEIHRRGGKGIRAVPEDKYFGARMDETARTEHCEKCGIPRKAGMVYLDGHSAHEDDGRLRADPVLVAVVEEMGPAANGDRARLEVVDIPDDVEWEIADAGGRETIEEKPRSW